MTTTLIETVDISWKSANNKKYLKFDFRGALSEEIAQVAITSWQKEFARLNSGEKVDLIWNCLEMNKYSAKAAKMWKQAMNEFKDQTADVWLVTNNTFIKMGAKTVTFLLPINLKVVSSEYEIL